MCSHIYAFRYILKVYPAASLVNSPPSFSFASDARRDASPSDLIRRKRKRKRKRREGDRDKEQHMKRKNKVERKTKRRRKKRTKKRRRTIGEREPSREMGAREEERARENERARTISIVLLFLILPPPGPAGPDWYWSGTG